MCQGWLKPKAELRAHIFGSRFSGLPDAEAECVPGINLPAGLWVVMSYTPFNCPEVVAEVVGPVSSKLEEDSRSGSYLSGCPGRGALKFLWSSLASHYWDKSLLFSIFSSLSGTIQEQKLREGFVSDSPLTCEK